MFSVIMIYDNVHFGLILLLTAVNLPRSIYTKPNIIYILADDLGYADVGFLGSKDIYTPNLDSMAYDGVILTNNYVQPICTPTRGALLTGRHPIHLGLQHSVILTPQPWGLGLEEKLLPHYLKEQGYANHVIGKWHLGYYAEEYTPTKRGFDSHFGFFAGRQDYWDHTINEVGWGLDFRRNTDLVKTAFGQYATEVFTQEAEYIITKHNTSQPLFLYIPHLAVHTANSWQPNQAPDEYIRRFPHIEDIRRRTFAGMVSYLDESVGRVVQALHDNHMLENSVIVFSTDNGGAAGNFQQGAGNNLPLRGLKQTEWEGGVRGCGFIWSPLLQKSPYKSRHLFQVQDWLPTLLHVAEYDMDSLPDNIDGIDQWDVLSQNLPNLRKEILHNIDPELNSWGIRRGDMKLLYAEKGYTPLYNEWYGPHGPDDGVSDKKIPQENYTNDGKSKQERIKNSTNWVQPILESMGRSTAAPHPFIVDCGGTRPDSTCQVTEQPCLFNVTADPCEYHNLANEMPELVEELVERIRWYNESVVDIRNKDMDSSSLPEYHGGFWVPWVDLGPPKTPTNAAGQFQGCLNSPLIWLVMVLIHSILM